MDHVRERKELLEHLKVEGFLKTERVEKAMMSVKREEFLLPQERGYAYADVPQGIGCGQTISAPHMVALMTELLELQPSDNILEIGSGSGYQAAVLARLVKKVYTIELEPQLAEFAKRNLERAGIRNAEVICGDGSKGWSKAAPYDKIIVTCACPDVPKPLFGQLKVNGLLVAPVGGSWQQELRLYRKTRSGIQEKDYGGCVFVPLRH